MQGREDSQFRLAVDAAFVFLTLKFKAMNTKFKVGQRVYCLVNGEGKITEIKKTSEYDEVPIKVVFEDGRHDYYTIEGKYYDTSVVSLSPYGWEVKEKQPEFETGERVWVSDDNDYWLCYYYSHCNNGIHYCFVNQQKVGNAIKWDYVRKFYDIPF